MKSSLAIWAVDPNEENKPAQFKTARTLAKLAKGLGMTIEPVCVLDADRLRVPASAFASFKKAYQLEAENLINKWVKELRIAEITKPRLLASGLHADTNEIATLIEYAHKSGASLIAVGTKSRKGLERFLLGSFAENLIMKSDVPLLVVNPKSPAPKKISRILFATDFSAASETAFRRLLPVAESLGAKVFLYFKFDYIVTTPMESMVLPPEYDRYLQADFESRKKIAAEWVRDAEKVSVEVETILDRKPGYAVDGIRHTLRKTKSDMIAMASSSGPVASVLVGSVTRQVIRTVDVPVWVIHPKHR